jgi:hypothetical protein
MTTAVLNSKPEFASKREEAIGAGSTKEECRYSAFRAVAK